MSLTPISALRRLVRFIGIPPGAILSDLPEAIGIPSFIQPDLVKHWRRVLARSSRTLHALPPANGPRIAFITTLGKGLNNPGYAAVLAYALRMRGAHPILIYCDAWLAGCELPSLHTMTSDEFVARGPRQMCERCFASGASLYRMLGLEVHALSEFVDDAAVAAIDRFIDQLSPQHYYDFSYKGIELGPQIEATITRFFFTNTVERSERAYAVAKRMMKGSIMMVEAVTRMTDRLQVDVVAPHFGAYASRGAAALAGVAAARRTVVWTPGYVDETLLLGEGESGFTEIGRRTSGPWTNGPLDADRDATVDGVLSNLADEPVDQRPSTSERDDLIRELDLDPSREIVALYTNVGYDTKLFYDTPAYPDVPGWIFHSIDLFSQRKEQLVIRIHPGELWLRLIGRDAVQTVAAIRQQFPDLPRNVRVVAPDHKLNSYALARAAKVSLLYASYIGLELAARGHPVVAVGRAAYSRKGFTIDAESREEYERTIQNLDSIPQNDPVRTARARRFAYYFYVQRHIPFAHWNHDQRPGLLLKDWWRVFRSLDDLRPRQDPNLDAICEQFLHGTEALTARPMPEIQRWRAWTGALPLEEDAKPRGLRPVRRD